MSPDRRSVEPAVRRMMEAMVHRGPDDEGFVELPFGPDERGPVLGLGFRRLAILDLSPGGHQPMMNPTTGDWLVFNGEVYNFRALRAELAECGVVFSGTGDTAVVLHALSRWKERALEKFQGMFALAFYDAIERRLLLARDPLGIKPLYVAALHDRFVFASEIQAIRTSGLVPLDPDVAGIASMLAYGSVQSPRTVFERIRSFPAGSHQWLDAGVVAGRPQQPPRRFWSFPGEIAPAREADAAAEVGRLLRESVRRHLVSEVPVGVLLSAGIDSALIAAHAREFSADLRAFTVGFSALTLDDESESAAATAASLGMRHVVVQVDPTALPRMWDEWLLTLDSPSIDGFNTWIVSQGIAQEGVVVALSGLGADELFGGYPSFERAAWLSRLVRSIALVPQELRSGIVSGLGSFSGRSGAFEKLGDLMAGGCSVEHVVLSLRRTLSNCRMSAIGLTPRELGLDEDYLAPDREGPSPRSDTFNTVSRLELVHYMGDMLLRDTDANGMRHSLELRVPYLDVSLVNYVTSLPGSTKRQARRTTKSLLRASGRGILAGEFVDRPKAGFELPIDSWLRTSVREQCEAAIATLEGEPFLDGQAVRRMWTDFLERPQSMHWSRPLALITLGSHLARSGSGVGSATAASPRQ